MSVVYEGMFLLDNDLVRAGWLPAKATVTGLIEKHGGKVLTARRWDERPLAYNIKRKNRATFLLAHYELEHGTISTFLRDLEINESVLRYLITGVEVVPPEELELSHAEEVSDFTVPEPPTDDAPVQPEQEAAGGASASAAPSTGSGSDSEGKEAPAEKTQQPDASPPAEAKTPAPEPVPASADSDQKEES